MRAKNSEKQPETANSKVRVIKIYPKHRENKNHNITIPEIRFSGNWLRKLGFRHGLRVTITASDDQLVLKVHPEDANRITYDEKPREEDVVHFMENTQLSWH